MADDAFGQSFEAIALDAPDEAWPQIFLQGADMMGHLSKMRAKLLARLEGAAAKEFEAFAASEEDVELAKELYAKVAKNRENANIPHIRAETEAMNTTWASAALEDQAR
eukprot:6102640-Prymnesium_polylepis.1